MNGGPREVERREPRGAMMWETVWMWMKTELPKRQCGMDRQQQGMYLGLSPDFAIHWPYYFGYLTFSFSSIK